jgi:asparagine synthase (glutamine-hydrolysing)
MCAIVGILEHDDRGQRLRPVLEKMARALAHRGPDERGIWTDGVVGLGSQRLRVVDLQTGQQPLVSEDGRLHLVANGEIYNADALRDALRARGHTFATATDTEVILHAYEEEGVACLDRLEGMFAFGLWDSRRARLVLARDRFGEKPLYYASLPREFMFASELKGLLVHPRVSRQLDWSAVAKYLAYDYVPSPDCIFSGIRKLPPAHYMEVEADGRICLRRYWSPPRPATAGPRPDEAAAEIVSLLRASVARQAECDVPWGSFLSGGVDSSMVVAVAAEHSRTPLRTFAVGFDEPSHDERRYAAEVAGNFGTEHRDILVRGQDVPGLLREVATVFDEPFADPTSLAAVPLARLARSEVTVALSGDGADELFCGYPTQTAHRAAEVFDRLPVFVRRGVQAAARRLPTSHRYLSFDFTLRRFLRDVERPAPERHLRWMGGIAPEKQRLALTPAIVEQIGDRDTYEDGRRVVADWQPETIADVATALDLVLYLAEDNLVQMDRASMSTALEVRAPFLDRRLAEYALRLPIGMRRGLWQTKPLLRRAARLILPPRIARRPKHGFGAPTGAWLRGPLRTLATDLLEPGRLRRRGIFEPAYVDRMLRAHLDGKANFRKELWSLMMFELWSEAYCGA